MIILGFSLLWTASLPPFLSLPWTLYLNAHNIESKIDRWVDCYLCLSCTKLELEQKFPEYYYYYREPFKEKNIFVTILEVLAKLSSEWKIDLAIIPLWVILTYFTVPHFWRLRRFQSCKCKSWPKHFQFKSRSLWDFYAVNTVSPSSFFAFPSPWMALAPGKFEVASWWGVGI